MKKNIIKTGIVSVTAALLLIFGFRISDKYFEIAKNLDIMASVYRDLNEYYVDSLDPEQLMKTGIEAMAQSLDPYTYYFSKEDMGDLDFQTTGEYGGVGTSIRKTEDSVIITDVLANAPFAKAGIRTGDIIVSLDGMAVNSMSLDQMSNLLKGKPGSELKIAVRHPFSKKIKHYTINREEVDIHGVAYTGMAANGIGYIKMIQFTRGVAGEMAKAVRELESAHPDMKGLILDIRGNPGGLLDEAVKTASLFIPTGDTILTTRGRVNDWNRVYRATAAPLDSHIPLAVLTDGRSASASEIVAGAIQDLDRGIIVGQRSFGKGLVQTTRNLPYGTKMKITTAKYYTPSGRCIQAIDYSNGDEDGSISYIPDSLKKDFYTKDGRVVMNGGGIEPDQVVHRKYLSDIAASLMGKHLIFDFATRYFYSHPSPPAFGEFHLENHDFDQFIQFLRNKNYAYKTRTEEALERFKDVAKEEGYYKEIDSDYQALQAQLTHNKQQDLIKHKQEIMQLLELEIVSRYYYQKGRIAQGLPSDNVVKTAVNLLDNPLKYRELLHK